MDAAHVRPRESTLFQLSNDRLNQSTHSDHQLPGFKSLRLDESDHRVMTRGRTTSRAL